ncbi:glycosyltransferase family 9 protein [Cupriavidus plantarum]|uniref:glycosyltransferase family 9 protein n=1 Tax=Cupriavidus plantarum TaxID=942865 RepID=UPI0038B3AC4D
MTAVLETAEMPKARTQDDPGRRRIAVFRALQLGDMLCAVPALRALREGEPYAHITLVGLPWASEFASRFAELVDDFMAFPGMPGMPEQPFRADAAGAVYAEARARRFDLAIQLHGSGTLSNEVVRRFEAREMAGYCASAAEAGVHRHGGELLVTWPDGNEIERLLALPRALGYPTADAHLAFPLRAVDHAGWRALADRYGLQPRGYVCVHPGARMLSRRWPVERFAEVARRLRERWPVVVTGAPDELPLDARLAGQCGIEVINLGGQTTLGTMAALIGQARLLVCNDTGASHIAAAMDTPSVVVSCGSDSPRWAPLDTALHRVLADWPPCRPCGWEKCPLGHPCAVHIGVDDVMRAIEHVLDEAARREGELEHA